MGEVLDTLPKDAPTVALPLAVWGQGYAEFLPRWWEGVKSLQRQPDEIVIVTDAANHQVARESVPPGYFAEVVKCNATQYADFWNIAIQLTTCDWFAICNVDDLFLPEALNDIAEADRQGCNLITDRIQDLDGGEVSNSRWNGEDIGRAWTMVGAEPMRRDLFIAAGGFPRGQRFADWALAMRAYKVGVRAFDSDIVRIIYDRGLRRKTVSSILNGPDVLNKGYQTLTALAKELDLL